MRRTGRFCLRPVGLCLLVSLLAACISTQPTPSPTASLQATAPPTPSLTAEPTLTPAPLVHYRNPALGFAVDYPGDWVVTDPIERVDPLGEASTAVEFRTHLYGYGHQAFGKYAVIVTVKASEGRSLTETVQHWLSPIVPSMREGIEITCCLNVGGEPATELLLPWPMGGLWGTREIVVVHEEREYWLTFYPRSTLDGVTPSDAEARAAFDTFLRMFTFIPVTVTPMPPRPTVTPVPTPTAGPSDGASAAGSNALGPHRPLPPNAIPTSASQTQTRCQRRPLVGDRFLCYTGSQSAGVLILLKR